MLVIAVLVVDEGANTAKNSSLMMHWHMHTFATVTLPSSGRGAGSAKLVIQLNGSSTSDTIDVALVSGDDDCPRATFSVEEVVNGPDPAAHGWKDLNTTRVTISANAQSCKRLSVAVGKGASAWAAQVKVHPLADWKTAGPTGN